MPASGTGAGCRYHQRSSANRVLRSHSALMGPENRELEDSSAEDQCSHILMVLAADCINPFIDLVEPRLLDGREPKYGPRNKNADAGLRQEPAKESFYESFRVSPGGPDPQHH